MSEREERDRADLLARVLQRVRAMGRDGDLVQGEEAPAGSIMAELDALESRVEASKRRVAVETRRHLADLEVIHSANRLVTVGTLTIGLAHEFGTPLGVILARAQMILTDENDLDEARKDAEHIVREIKRMTRMCREVLDYARPREPAKLPIEAVDLVRNTIGLLNLDVRRRRVKLVFDEPEAAVFVRGDASRLMQVLTNIVINGAQAMPAGGTVRVRIAVRSLLPPAVEGLAEREYVCIDVEDTGVGIRSADLAHIFDTFFTTKKAGEGTGLGLAVSYRIVREHEGWIGVKTVEGAGSTFTIHLPKTDEPQ